MTRLGFNDVVCISNNWNITSSVMTRLGFNDVECISNNWNITSSVMTRLGLCTHNNECKLLSHKSLLIRPCTPTASEDKLLAPS